MVFRYHYWNRKLPELMLRTLLTADAQTGRFKLRPVEKTRLLTDSTAYVD